MSAQKALPVLTSIGIILVVAVLRDRSRTVAAIVATMPINVPLALWVVSAGGSDSPVLADFMRSALLSLIPSILWLGVVYWALRAGWAVWPAVGVGYVVWAVLIAGLFYTGAIRLG